MSFISPYHLHPPTSTLILFHSLHQESIRSSEEGATFSSVPFDYNSLNSTSTATGSGSDAYDPHEATASAEATENEEEEEEEEEEDDDDDEDDETFVVPEILKCPMGMTVSLSYNLRRDLRDYFIQLSLRAGETFCDSS